MAGNPSSKASRPDLPRRTSATDDGRAPEPSADKNDAATAVDWDSLAVQMPQRKAVLNMRVDRDVLDFFRQQGKGYQTRINAVLRAYVTRMLNG
jgi:uncharacterized protein (DUF4415 family)